GWAEPWAALGATLGLADERPALRAAWRALLENQAHDSIGGCSQDRVHDQMVARYDAADELARETPTRTLERIAGLARERGSPAGESFDVAVFNPSPQPRTDVVRLRLVPARWITLAGGVDPEVALHPWLRAGLAPEGYTVDGRPASLVVDHATDRIRLLPDVPPRTLEFVASDVPAFGWRRFRVAASGRHDAEEDDGREIAAGGVPLPR